MFEFEVRYWDEDTGKAVNARGILGAESYIDATKKAIDYCSIPGHSGAGVISVKVSELENPLDWEELKDWVKEKREEWD